MNQTWLRKLAYYGFVWPTTNLIVGHNVYHRDRLPLKGPAIYVANHNSHLDTLIIWSIAPPEVRPNIRPVGAADYWLKGPIRRWLALDMARFIQTTRSGTAGLRQWLADCEEALGAEETVLIFPEGSRGLPEHREEFKGGIAHLAKRHPDVPVVPINIYGAGKSLPRGEGLLVPFICDVVIGEPFLWTGDKASFMEQLTATFAELESEIPNRDDWSE
jgi:1-acyl-sn-glycerol-3-phosphate acyltransferase